MTHVMLTQKLSISDPILIGSTGLIDFLSFLMISRFLAWKVESGVECHVPNFALGHNCLITFSIFMRVCQIDAKGQIIAKEENY